LSTKRAVAAPGRAKPQLLNAAAPVIDGRRGAFSIQLVFLCSASGLTQTPDFWRLYFIDFCFKPFYNLFWEKIKFFSTFETIFSQKAY
jgi:hypothetical protein